jgi:hypothetical protein
VLLVELRRGIDVARIGRGVLGDRPGRDLCPAPRAARIEAPGVEVLGAARRWADDPVLGAAIHPFAVHDHARGQHEPPAEASSRELAQQHRGTDVVVRDVVGHVEEVDPEPDHARLVAHVVDAADRPRHRLGVAQVVTGPKVEDTDLMAGVSQGLDDVRSDEPCASGDEHDHRVNGKRTERALGRCSPSCKEHALFSEP